MTVLAKIIPERAYKTTDGKVFVGDGAKEKAEDHQRWLNNNNEKKIEKKKGVKKRRRKNASRR